jgi:hypothetical protein
MPMAAGHCAAGAEGRGVVLWSSLRAVPWIGRSERASERAHADARQYSVASMHVLLVPSLAGKKQSESEAGTGPGFFTCFEVKGVPRPLQLLSREN